MPENRKRLVRRLGELLVLVVGVLIAASVLQLRTEAGSQDPRHVAASFLSVHAEVLAQVGAVSRVEDVAPQNVSAGPPGRVETYYLEVVGARGTVRAEVEMKQGPEGNWHVHAATLFTREGPVPLLDSAACKTCSNV